VAPVAGEIRGRDHAQAAAGPFAFVQDTSRRFGHTPDMTNEHSRHAAIGWIP